MNLTLTPKRPQSELVQLLKSTANAQVKKERRPNALRYLSAREMDQHMQEIHDRLFRRLATARDREACLEIAKGFTYTIPYVDIYLALLSRIAGQYPKAVREAYGEVWHLAPTEWRNHIEKGAKKYMEKAGRASDELSAFVNRQAGHLNALSDEQAELVMDLESTEIEVKISTEPGYYIEPAPEEEKYLMSCRQVAVYLAQQSKGAIYLTPVDAYRALRPDFRRKGKLFYVKIK